MNGGEKLRKPWSRALGLALRLLAVALSAVGLLLMMRSLANRATLDNYNSGNYSDFPERLLSPLKLGDDYVVPYNLGSLAYQREEYERAAAHYAEALRAHPPAEGTECATRVNLALSLLHAYPFDDMDPSDRQQAEEALAVLRTARRALTENGCACEEAGASDGHSETAEALKRDIDKMIARLAAPPPADGESGDDKDGDGDGDGDAPPEEPAQGDSRQDKPDDPDGETQEERQRALQARLDEQKQALEAGSYRGSGARDYTYVDIGETIGFGEGAPW